MRGGGIRRFRCGVNGTGAGLCTFGDCRRCKLGIREGGGDGVGTFRDNAEVNFINDGIGGRELFCLCCKRGEGVKGGYMFVKNLQKLF